MVNHPGMPNNESHIDEFVRQLTSHQRDIYLYIRSLMLASEADVDDVVQNTNVVLWEKRDQFITTLDFRPWAFQIARYKVSEYQAQHKRKCVCFSDALVDELALQSLSCANNGNELTDELLRCIAQLAARDREILNRRYSLRESCESIAKELERPIRWVYNTMNRIRRELFDCMGKRISIGKKR